jgi:ribonuclease HI
VENRDLWEGILKHISKHTFRFVSVKGHVNLNSEKTNIDGIYKKFTTKNGSDFSKEDFLYITEMNNRADALANDGIDSVRE